MQDPGPRTYQRVELIFNFLQIVRGGTASGREHDVYAVNLGLEGIENGAKGI